MTRALLVTPIPCARPGCHRQVRYQDARYCGRACAKVSYGLNAYAEGPLKPTPAADSWWLDKAPADFFDAARKRFPETGSAIVSRGKEFLYGPNGPSIHKRANKLRRGNL